MGAGLNEANAAFSQGTQTILFTDLEGSTDLRVRVGDAVANQVIKEHDQLVRAEIEVGGGVDIKSLGDGFMALFGSANRAIETAVSIQRAIVGYNESNPERVISVRIGLNSGDVTQSEGEAHGTAVHAASRVAAKAQGGQILISQVVSDIAGSLGGTRVVDRGLFWLKGFPERWRLYEVLWRDKEGVDDRPSREVKQASAAAFDPTTPRSEGRLVGRKKEQQVISEQIAATPSGGLRAVVLEGEAGIGKTRMLEATIDLATSADTAYWALDVSTDEELRGPFLLFRSLLNSPRMASVAREAMALEQLDRAQEAISGKSAAMGEGLSPQEQMLRMFDEVASAFSSLTRERPLALLFDDLQWADEDSIQLIRYLVRTLPTAPIFLLITIRPYYESGGAGKLIADLDRMRVTQVLRLERFTRAETAELLRGVLGSPVDDQTLQAFHARSEGVPFFIEEFARAYREADALQLMDGTWTMTRLSGPAVPSSVQSLIERRLAQLPEDSRSLLADAGVLGRRFRLRDLAPVLAQVRREAEVPDWELAEDLDTAVQLGLIVEEPHDADYDFSFSHDQIRASLLDGSPRRRQQAIHGAIAEILGTRADPEDLSMLAYHSMKAGNSQQAVSTALTAAKAALEASAPEESLRLIDATLPAASEPVDRIEMLRVKDDAFELLDRGIDRIANLAEMTALTGAVSSQELEMEVKLRRSSAARSIEDFDTAATLATSVRDAAVESGDMHLELRACFELGQAAMRCAIGEGYWPISEVDLDAADEPYTRALEIARSIGSRSDEAIALRELAVVEGGRVRKVAEESIERGVSKFEIIEMGPTLFAGAKELAEQAFRIFDEIGDRRGSMSALISMAYAHVTDPTAHGLTGRMEHIRALHNSRRGQVTESQRATEDALMLFSIHVYARETFQTDLALDRGKQAFEAARALGDRWLETLAAGGIAMTYSSFGAADDASAWLDNAAAAARTVPSTSMAHRLEMWRGTCAAARGDADGVRDHYGRAAELAVKKNLAVQAEAYCALAIELAKLAVVRDDANLLEQAMSAAEETLDRVQQLPGQLPWDSVAHAVKAVGAHAAGRSEEAADEARYALTTLDGLTHIRHFIDVLWAAGRVLIGQGEPESEDLSHEIAQGLGYLSMSMVDLDIKTRWFEVPSHRELAQLIGFDLGGEWGAVGEELDLTNDDLDLLRAITSGSSDDAGSEEDISSLFAKLGVDSETGAIKYAIQAGVTWQ
jgi:class 3 adenylate cyclase/tetratricopeptide (TPR) repeat protein